MGEPKREVVGAAIVRGGRVLAAQRSRPAPVAGRWELPGGKVETDESADVALVREVAEELGCEIAIRRWLDGREPINAFLELRVALAVLVGGEPMADPSEHSALRWLTAAELTDVDWLESDLPFVDQLREHLAGPAD